MATFDLHIINPPKKKTAKKKAKKAASRRRTAKKTPAKQGRKAPMAAPKKKAAKKKAAKRRTTNNLPAKRRTTNPCGKKKVSKRRRTKNPFGIAGIATQLKGALPRFGGKLAVAWTVKRIGNGSSWGGATSELAGGAWNWQQYMGAILVAMYGGKLLGKFIGSPREFSEGAWDLIMMKALWTEGISRSEWAVEQFGADGDVQYNQNTGQMMIEQGGRMVNMQGLQGGTLVEAGPLDGFGALEDGPALSGGTLVSAGPLDGEYYDPTPVAGPVGNSPYNSQAVYG